MASITLAHFPRALVFAVLTSWLSSTVHADDFMQQSFSFQWQNYAVPVPTTTQCDTLNIQWSRAATDTGPSAVAPYYLQIYTSAYVYPFVVPAGSALSFNFAVPFGPGTLYQICMFDSVGNTGGCQGIYTVIPNANSTLSCSNDTLTFPLGPLDVDAQVNNGPLSQYGWVPECTDITVTPKNGTAPYTFTIAPTLHPPLNITSNSASPNMTWTVDLSWASPFFVSVTDSAGSSWAYGPLHSGQGNESCIGSNSKGIPAGAVAGAGVGGVVVGLLGGCLIAFCFLRRRKQKYSGLSTHGSPVMTPYEPQLGGRLLNSSTGDSHSYHVEPFILPGLDSNPPSPSSGNRHAQSSSNDTSQSRSVYVVHHDGGRAPVTVYHEDGTEVVELPPRYIDGSTSASSGRSERQSRTDTSSDATADATSPGGGQLPAVLQSQRQPRSVSKKPSHLRSPS